MKKYIVIFSTVGLLLVIVGYFIFQKMEHIKQKTYAQKSHKYYSATTLEEAIEGVKYPYVRTPEVVLNFMDNHSQEDVLKLIQLTGNVRGYWINDTALTAAARLGYLSVVKYLIEQGADVNETFTGQTGPLRGSPLLSAVENRDLSMIRYLVEQGANIHQRIGPEFRSYQHSYTPWLLSLYGNIITPFKRAIELGYDEIVDFFKKQHIKKY